MAPLKVEILVAALRENFCPRPCNARPDSFSVGACFDAGECGCMNHVALGGEPYPPPLIPRELSPETIEQLKAVDDARRAAAVAMARNEVIFD